MQHSQGHAQKVGCSALVKLEAQQERSQKWLIPVARAVCSVGCVLSGLCAQCLPWERGSTGNTSLPRHVARPPHLGTEIGSGCRGCTCRQAGGPSCAVPQLSPGIWAHSFFLVTCCPKACLRPLCDTNPGARFFSRIVPCVEAPA